MPKFELTKSIEAVKLNARTLRPLSRTKHTIPFGAILDKVLPEGETIQFHYLGEPYEATELEMKTAVRQLP